MDKLAAAAGVRKDSAFDALVVEVGEKCQLYSRDTDEWVSGKVVAVNASGGVCFKLLNMYWESSRLCTFFLHIDMMTSPMLGMTWSLRFLHFGA